ncbi:CHAT domain-containing protein [Coniochaeta sp. 2T2.1]|nr:CHAT domain-containing protein [Coniochaeta sp. 2T2.1]
MLERSDQQFVVSTFAGVGHRPMRLSPESNQPADALYYLERGRAVIIGQLVDARSAEHRDEIDAPVRLEQEAAAQMPSRRREALSELDACIHEIRGITGFERFLLGQIAAEMQECASGGTIVVVNVVMLRSDAILVSADAIKTVNLPWLTASDAEVWLGKKWRGPRSERAQKNKEYLEYLSWLWEACVRQVLVAVGGGSDLADGLPKIWWLGTGLVCSMPFYAAGTHADGSRENAFSRAISSYTSSIRALGHVQHRARATETAHGSLLIATMPTTPSNGDMRDSRKPGLILQSCEAGLAKQDRLTVRRVSELSLAGARLAYLSACSTAENKAARLADEVIHVVSGFQVAGFPHVVGCLWPSIDRVCVEVARRFYSSLLGRRSQGWDDATVASSLREAVMAVRATELGTPLTWAQFVHYGA